MARGNVSNASTSGERMTRRRAREAEPAAPSERAVSTASPARKRGRNTSNSRSKREESSEDDADDDAELLASVSKETRKMTSKRQRGKSAILAEFSSLDALLSNDFEEKQRKQRREDKLKQLREESKTIGKRGGIDTSSPLARLMSEMENNMSSLSADNHLFTDDLPRSQEKFGFVFTPITEPLPYTPFKATAAELKSELGLVYKTLQSKNEDELSALLWSKAILLRCLLTGKPPSKAKVTSTSPVQPVVVPARIGSWLFMTMSTHSNSHIVKGCLSNLFVLVASSGHLVTTDLNAGLACASFCHSPENLRGIIGEAMPDLQMEWRPTVYDFLNAFRRFGFQDSKRSMSAKSKITPTNASSSKRSSLGSNKAPVPFPTLNMRYVLVFLILSIRANLLRLDGYDAFSFTMFFLRMQFEHNMHPEIVQLASICIEELLEVFPTLEWRKEWAPSLVLRIAGASEGLFDSASGWLMVARRLPRTARGTQLTTGLAVYVLQHRIDKSSEAESNSERPLKFPIQSGLVLDIVAGIVEDMTVKYTEKKNRSSPGARAQQPPYDLLCKKVALMDLALQAFLNVLTQKEMSILLKKLDDLTGSHKSTMSAKWHELKTLVGLMHRKYSLENLRIGRDAEPSAMTVLFVDDAKD
ncbi:hypothetical protein Poli38472_003300 [Pythium oligandrum]|uniref:Uncharacterized protein n=1 Tax=Pythium oligandrum TaxID=41045 RepID=A0A8K1FBK2_PYTOL|nr:hypothetical protein Poli38472_003300 [Pythium oligandrum]|eukprot:TMW57375.1 hypothetical protein Poli38472_003300 [Pythium oligandrum]